MRTGARSKRGSSDVVEVSSTAIGRRNCTCGDTDELILPSVLNFLAKFVSIKACSVSDVACCGDGLVRK